jgi:hypothetical protein
MVTMNDKRAQVLQPEGHQQVVVDDVAGTGGDGEHEGGRRAHAESRLQLLGDAHERAQAENLDQDNVIDEDSADNDEQIMGHGSRDRRQADSRAAAIIPVEVRAYNHVMRTAIGTQARRCRAIAAAASATSSGPR